MWNRDSLVKIQLWKNMNCNCNQYRKVHTGTSGSPNSGILRELIHLGDCHAHCFCKTEKRTKTVNSKYTGSHRRKIFDVKYKTSYN